MWEDLYKLMVQNGAQGLKQLCQHFIYSVDI